MQANPHHMATCCSPVVERRAADALKSSRTVASADFINYVPKLEAAKGTPSVQMVSAGADGTIDFPASVDFGPTHVIVPGATGIRRRRRRLGAVGEDG